MVRAFERSLFPSLLLGRSFLLQVSPALSFSGFGVDLELTNGSVVLLECAAELMGAIVVRDKIKVFARSGLDCGKDRISTRVGDGAGGESFNRISVVRSLLKEVASLEVSGVTLPNAINGRRIALKTHFLSQAI